MMKSQNSAIGRSHVVWLDVVRFVAMFTVVCCHSTDPFNFYRANLPPISIRLSFGELPMGRSYVPASPCL